MQKAIFQNQQKVVATLLYQSQQTIDIAMCWFTHPLFFSILLKKAGKGLTIRLIVQFDQANFNPKGLPFKELINLGAEVYAFRQNKLLHHKFVVIDDRRLLTGSYNWTGTDNADNLLFSDAPDLVRAYQNEFQRLWQNGESLKSLIGIKPPAPSFLKLFEPIAFNVLDLRHAIIWGSRVWIAVFTEAESDVWQQCRQMQRHFLKIKVDYFDQNKPAWDREDFSKWVQGLSLAKKRLLNNYCLKMKVRDIIVAVSDKGVRLASGLVGSTPEPGHLETYSFVRYVQWFEFPVDVQLLERIPKTCFTLYRESGLELISPLTNRKAA